MIYCHPANTGVRRIEMFAGSSKLDEWQQLQPIKPDKESIDFLVMLIEAKPCTALREMTASFSEMFPRKRHITT